MSGDEKSDSEETIVVVLPVKERGEQIMQPNKINILSI